MCFFIGANNIHEQINCLHLFYSITSVSCKGRENSKSTSYKRTDLWPNDMAKLGLNRFLNKYIS